MDLFLDPFFLIYVMSGVVNNKLLLYENGSAVLVADKSTSNTELLPQREPEVVSDWLIDNKLSLRLGKTASILFGAKVRLNVSVEFENLV